jgi:proliferating cell nuclear antigen
MFEAKIAAGKLQRIASVAGPLVDECKARLGEDGLTIQAVDPANVGMVDLSLPKEDFETYAADEELLGINLVRFGDVVGMGNKDDPVELELDEERRKLRVETGGLRYTLSLIDPDSIHQEPQVPELDNAEYDVVGADIQQAVKAAGLVSDHLAFRMIPAEEPVLEVSAEGDTDSVKQEIKRGFDTDADETQSSLFSLDYLNEMSKELPKDGVVTVELGDDYPIKFGAELCEHGEMTYLLAPRIENE